jgi:NAD(P)H-dependent FMN reductase
MSRTPKILALAGSLRAESYNKKLVKIAAESARRAGAEVRYIDLRDYPLPIFDQDLEAKEGLPANARKLKDLFIGSDGLLISAAEYNSSITAVLKNTIDWVSRPVPNEAPLAGFAGKVAAIMSASPGELGGLRGLVHVRAILGNIQTLVLPDQVSVPRAAEAFNEDGTLKDARKQAGVEKLGEKLAAILGRLL